MSDAVSLTTFVDFVSKSGTPKATVVRSWKERGEYSVAADYYRQLRDAIVDCHCKGLPIPDIGSGVPSNKQDNYRLILDGHDRWVRRKKLAWFDPPFDLWTSGNLSVSINPELGLEIDGVPYLVKLYFKAEKLTKNRAEIITHLMNVVLSSAAPQYCVMGVLDLRNAKLIASAGPIPSLDAQLQAEAAYWNTLWANI